MSESSATKTLRDNLVSRGAHIQRIEDKLTSGIPDTNACLNGTEFWAEGKFLKELPKRNSTLATFGKKGEPRLIHQCNWLTARAKAGGLTFWWLRVRDGDGAGWYIFHDVEEFQWLKTGVPKIWLLEFENKFPTAKTMVDYIQEVLVPNHHQDV